ncbi:MAG: universal stress protein E [Planctomycetota bacterium]|jgi:universal stress protein E
MSSYKRILVGLDLSPAGEALTPGSSLALEQAIGLARAGQASLQLVHSTRLDDYKSSLRGSKGIVHEGLPDAGRRALDEGMMNAQDAGVDASLVLTSGRPWIDIIQMVQRDGIDLVVVGKRNEPSTDGRKLGSMSIKLLRKCPCPVYVVRGEKADIPHLVLAATDLTPVGDAAVGAAQQMAAEFDCPLHVVNAWVIPMSLQMKSSRMSKADYVAEVGEIQSQVESHIKHALPDAAGPQPELHAIHGAPAQTLRDAVERLQPSLLVMGTVSRSGIAGLLIGSTAERMLDQVDCSILTLKPEGFVSPVKAIAH